MAGERESIFPEGSPRTRLLAINFFPAFVPPSSGGEERYFRLYQHLSGQFDVTLVSATFPDAQLEIIEHSPSLREIRVPKPSESDTLHWQLQTDGIGPECSALVVALAAAFDTTMTSIITEEVAKADIVIHDSPFTLPYDVGAGLDGVTRIYNAYNVETELATQMFKGDVGRTSVAFVRELEERLIGCCTAILAISDEERDTFVRDFGFLADRIFSAPNGFEPVAVPASVIGERTGPVLFLGSNHPPNVEALSYIANELAPSMPGVQFKAIGSVCKAYVGPVPPNLELAGFVGASEKDALLWGCRAAINPLVHGSGTNLKMLDYLSHGAPVVSTSVGARGLGLMDGVHVVLAEQDEFAAALGQLLADDDRSCQLADAGLSIAHAKYTWAAIADGVSEVIERILSEEAGIDARAKLLVVCDYEIHAARSGGQVRMLELFAELGREFQTTLLTFTSGPSAQSRRLADGLLQVSIPKTAEHRRAEVESNKGEVISVVDLVASEMCLRNDAFVARFAELSAEADIVLFEQCYLSPLLAHVPVDKPIVYSSQNVESELKRQILAVRQDGAERARQAATLEHAICERAGLVIAVSREDANRFRQEYPDTRCIVVENGVRLPAIRRRIGDTEKIPPGSPLVVFVGSAHGPNISAAEFIIREIAVRNPEVAFALVGSVHEALNIDDLPGNVILMGFLEVQQKEALFAIADLAINPMFEGGGSSLKVPDFLAAGLPLLSTVTGIRGFDGLEAGENCYLADAEEMAALIPMLLSNKENLAKVSASAFEYAARVDWRVLGGKARRWLRGLIERKGPVKALAVTYRFTDPPKGGAETFLFNVIPGIVGAGDIQLDVAATDVSRIQDHLHFSALYSPLMSGEHTPAHAGSTYIFEADPPIINVMLAARRLHHCWMRESHDLARHFPELVGVLLLGGWNAAEHRPGGKTVRWTGLRAEVVVKANVHKMIFVVHSPAHSRVTAKMDDGSVVGEWSFHGNARLQVKLAGIPGVLTLHVENAFVSPDDPRELGILVTAIEEHTNDERSSVDLAQGFEELALQQMPREWVRALAEVARARPRSIDGEFVAIRGPHSAALDAWLDEVMPRYDVVLAQGIPFATPIAVAAAASRHGVPLVVLPHFHMEDRYYHWRSYQDLFSQAACVIAAPAASKPWYFDGIGARSKVLNGGGFSAADFSEESLAVGRMEFSAMHVPTRPFVLVLGRKTGAKHYQDVLDAVARARATGAILDVVLIGPDEDGVPVSDQNVFAYGAQPRAVVVGALQAALCVANMSESESFGIVLVEAWMAGTPVVARRSTTSFAELVEDGVNGRLVESPDELLKALMDYLDDPSLAKVHAAAGRERAEGATWEALGHGIADVLKRAAQAYDSDDVFCGWPNFQPDFSIARSFSPLNGDGNVFRN